MSTVTAEELAKNIGTIQSLVQVVGGLLIFHVVKPAFAWIGAKIRPDPIAKAVDDLRSELDLFRKETAKRSEKHNQESNEYRARLASHTGETQALLERWERKMEDGDPNLPKDSAMNWFHCMAETYALAFRTEVTRVEQKNNILRDHKIIIDGLHIFAQSLHRKFMTNARCYSYKNVPMTVFVSDLDELFRDTSSVCMDALVLNAQGNKSLIAPGKFHRYFEDWRSHLMGNFITYMDTGRSWKVQNTNSRRYEQVLTSNPGEGEVEFFNDN